MQLDFARAGSKAASSAAGRVLLARGAKAKALRGQCLQHSQVKDSFEVPEIHFGVEQPPSSSSASSSADSPCFTLRTSLHLRVPLQRVWQDFHVPRTLDAITPPHLNFTVTSPQPVQMGEGTIIDYRHDPPPVTSTPQPSTHPPPAVILNCGIGSHLHTFTSIRL